MKACVGSEKHPRLDSDERRSRAWHPSPGPPSGSGLGANLLRTCSPATLPADSTVCVPQRKKHVE
eukprot:766488-Rhodomonas_salina.1